MKKTLKRRIVNILCVIVSYIFFLYRGSAKHLPQNIKNFVVIYPTNNIGDMVCVTPVFHAIKKQDPTARVTVIGSQINKGLLENHPCVDSYILYTDNLWSLIKEIRFWKFDAGVVINMDTVSVAAMFLGEVTSISGLFLHDAKYSLLAYPYKIISKLIHAIEYTPGTYIPEKLLDLLYPFGIYETDATKNLAFSECAKIDTIQLLEKNRFSENEKIIAIAPGAGSDLKRWPAERFARISEYMYLQGFRTIIIGGPNDQRAVEEYFCYVGDKNIAYYPGSLSMEFLKAILARAALLIGNDSGAVHVAEAVGTTTIAIVGATDDSEHLKQSDTHLVIRGVKKDDSVYQSYVGNEKIMDKTLAQSQMESVTINMVTDAISRMDLQ